MAHLYSLLKTLLPFKRPSPAVADTAQPPKRRRASHRGDGDEDALTADRQLSIQTESPSCGYAGQQVFLSHSGHQKSFVEQLFLDLQRENISCFFDKDSQSLPKGENFPTLIFEAAQPYMTSEAAGFSLRQGGRGHQIGCKLNDPKTVICNSLRAYCTSDISLDLARISNRKTFSATTKILQTVELKRKGFVESSWEYSDGLYIHDLHKEFAENKANGTEKWILVKKSRHIPSSLQEASSSDRPRFSAVKFDSWHFQGSGYVNDELFRNVLVLHLQDMPQLKILNLSPMKIVRSITIVECWGMQEIRGLETLTSLVYFRVEGCSANVRFSGIEGLLALEHLEVDVRHRGRTTESSPLSWTSFPPLQSGSIVGDRIENGAERLDLSLCSRLRTIQLSGCDMVEIDVSGCLELTKIEIRDCKNLSEINQFNSNLGGLEITTVCSALTFGSLPRLGPAFFNLTEFKLSGLQNLKVLPVITRLTALRKLALEGMQSLKELPALTGLTVLRQLSLEGMHSLKELPALTGLTALRYLRLNGMHSLKELPALTGLTALENLYLMEMHSLKELPALTGLPALKILSLERMHSLKELPSLTRLNALELLWLEGMQSLKELPTLTGLTALENVELERMHRLKELPALIGFKYEFDNIWLGGTHRLNEISHAGLRRLREIWFEKMDSVKEPSSPTSFI